MTGSQVAMVSTSEPIETLMETARKALLHGKYCATFPFCCTGDGELLQI
jgi:hypothetical protein